MKNLQRLLLFVLSVLTLTQFAVAQRDLGTRPTDSGGPLMAEQAAYDVLNYDISAQIYPEKKRFLA